MNHLIKKINPVTENNVDEQNFYIELLSLSLSDPYDHPIKE